VTEWRPIDGQPGYFVSDEGQVRHHQRVLKGTFHPKGYKYVHTRDGMFKVHKLVAAAFLGPNPGKLYVCHINDVKADNRVENLRYGTPSDNMRDRTRNGRCPAANQTHCIRGHAFDEANTYWHPRVGKPPIRACRACRLADKRRRNAEDLKARIDAGIRPPIGYCNKGLHDLNAPGALLSNGVNGRRLCAECRREYCRTRRLAARQGSA
jgi:hypothetical protein